MTCVLPKGYFISTDNGCDDFFYLTAPDREVIGSGDDPDDLFVLAWRDYREKRSR